MDKNINEQKSIKRQIELTQKSPSLSFCVWKETGAKAGFECAGSERNMTLKPKLTGLTVCALSSLGEALPLFPGAA